MKKLILILTFLSFNFSIKAQEKINYTDKSKKIEFEISKDEFIRNFHLTTHSYLKINLKTIFKN